MSRINTYTDSMPQLSKLLARIPELEDQLNLLTDTIEADGPLSQENLQLGICGPLCTPYVMTKS